METWPHLRRLAGLFEAHRLVEVLKARQVGVSWLLGAYGLWHALYHEGAYVEMFSRGQVEAAELLEKARFIHRNLPTDLRIKVGKDSGSELSFPSMSSKIVAFPSTEDTGRSQNPSLIIWDEADFHEFLDASYTAAKPPIDAGGQAILVSTANKRKMMSLFKALYRGSPGNGFVKMFLPWTVRPGRDEAWYEATKASVPVTSGLTPELYMEQEYPGTEEEALAPSKAMAFFNRDALTSMLEDCQEPKEMRRGGLVRVWRKPVVAGRYVAGGDCAWGQKGSYSCLVVADWQTGEQVAEVYGRPALDEAALVNVEVCKEYNNAYVGIEENGEGAEVVKKMRELGYGDHMYCRTPQHAEAQKRSWLTDAGTRPVMLAELEEAVRLRRVVPRCRDAIGEMMSFIRNEQGKADAAQGAYDDRVMAWAVLWQMRPHAHFRSTSEKVAKMPYGW